MTAQRRRDPRLPGPAQEDVETIVNGETVTSYELSPVDELIVAAHQDALDRVRYMWGIDRDDWLLAAEELSKTHPDLAVVVLRKWCDIAIAARAHDSREPDPWGFLKLARLHHRGGRHDQERAVLEEWLANWPEDRDTAPGERGRTIKRLEKECGSSRR